MVEFGSPNNRKDERDRSTSEIVMFEMSIVFFKNVALSVHFIFSRCVCASDARVAFGELKSRTCTQQI